MPNCFYLFFCILYIFLHLFIKHLYQDLVAITIQGYIIESGGTPTALRGTRPTPWRHRAWKSSFFIFSSRSFIYLSYAPSVQPRKTFSFITIENRIGICIYVHTCTYTDEHSSTEDLCPKTPQALRQAGPRENSTDANFAHAYPLDREPSWKQMCKKEPNIARMNRTNNIIPRVRVVNSLYIYIVYFSIKIEGDEEKEDVVKV